MELFNKKENQQNYINLIRQTAEEAMLQLPGWDMTLTTLESGALVNKKIYEAIVFLQVNNM